MAALVRPAPHPLSAISFSLAIAAAAGRCAKLPEEAIERSRVCVSAGDTIALTTRGTTPSGPDGRAHVRMPGFTYTISQDRRPLASPKLCATNVFQTRLFSPHVTDGTTTCQSHIGKSAYKERRSLPRDPPARVWLRRS